MRVPVLDPSWPDAARECHRFDQIRSESPRAGYTIAYRRRQAVALGAVRAVAAPGATVLDVAAGQGNFTLPLAEVGYRVIWNDLRDDLIPLVEAKREVGEVTYLPGDIFDVAPDPVDVVLACEVIEHVAHPDRFLARLASLARPGGHVVLTTPNGRYWRNRLPRFSDFGDTTAFEEGQFRPDASGHIFLLHPDELRDLAHRAGLDVVEHRTFTNTLTNGGPTLDPLLRVLPPRLVDAVDAITSRWSRLNVHQSATLSRSSPAGR